MSAAARRPPALTDATPSAHLPLWTWEVLALAAG
jgi:hypothetical protein